MNSYGIPGKFKDCIKSVILKITRLCIKVISVYEKGVIISGMIKDYKALTVLPLQGE